MLYITLCVIPFLFGIMLRMTPKKQAPLNPFILIKKTVFMQRICDLVRTGHTRYIQGVILLEKAGFMASKFDERFQVERGKLEASRARKRGEHSARLLFWLPEDSVQVHWILLYCPGTILDTSEKWREATDDRVQLTGYELVRQTKTGADHAVWTWRYTRTRHDELREAVVQAIRRGRDDELRQLIHTLWRSPGFAGIRDQVKKFKDVIKAEWKRSRKTAEGMPETPAHLGYLRRLPDVGKRLSVLLAERPGISPEKKLAIKKSLKKLLGEAEKPKKMAAMTAKDRDDLVQQAAEKRAANPDYRPTVAELRAIDELLVEQARERLLQEAVGRDQKQAHADVLSYFLSKTEK